MIMTPERRVEARKMCGATTDCQRTQNSNNNAKFTASARYNLSDALDTIDAIDDALCEANQ